MSRRPLVLAALLLAFVAPAAAAPDPAGAPRVGARVAEPAPPAAKPRPKRYPAVAWRRSAVLGTPQAGALVRGVLLPVEGRHHVTWDPVAWRSPNPAARRWGSDRLVRTLLGVLARYRAAHPGAPRVVVGDLSRPHGGSFDARHGVVREFGGHGTLGHVSHQNGLDADVYYPRVDRRRRAPDRLEDVDRPLAQALVHAFVASRPQFVFVGPRLALAGPPGVVQALVRHDDHLHVRLRP